MSAFAPIVISDGQTTPVAHTFAPEKIDVAGVAKFVDRVAGIAIGFPVITFAVKSPSKTSRNYRVTGKVVIPTLEVTSPATSTGIQPAPTRAYELIGTFEFVLPERSTILERTNALAYMKNLLANANVTNAVVSFENIY